MIGSLLYKVVRRLLSVPPVLLRRDTAKKAELLVLRLGLPGGSLQQHEKIAEAIRRGDPAAAERAMRHHLKTVSEVRLLTWNPDNSHA